MRDDKEFRNWYKQRIENQEEWPPEQVWENIQDDLDIDDVWENIQDDLSQKNRKVLFTHVSYAFSAAAALLLIIFILFPPQLNQEIDSVYRDISSLQQDNQKPQDAEITSFSQTSFSEKTEEKLVNNSIKLFNSKNRKAITTQPAIHKQKQTIDEVNRQLASLFRALPMDEESDQLFLVRSDESPSGNIEAAEADHKTKPEFNYYVGTAGQFANNWLISDKTVYSIRQSPYSSAKPSRNNALSLMAGIHFNEKWDLQIETQFQNNNGQIYKEYMDGNFVTNHIQLNYSSIRLIGRYQFIDTKENIPVSHHLEFGVYGSYLQNAYQDINSEKENLQSAYKNYDLGVVAGYSIETQLLKNFSLTTGVKVDPGMINVYEGTETMPAEFNKTYTSSFSIQLALKYKLQ